MPVDATLASQSARDSAPMVSLVGVTKLFPGVVANDAIDLAIHAGEVHVLLGENGAGKSTLVAILCGLQRPDAGEVWIDGKPVRLTSPAAALAQGIGAVFQHVMLSPTLTVAENLLLAEPWWKQPDRAGLARKIAAITRDFGLAVDLDAPTGSLSLGEQQQVEIVRALLRESRVLIFDESTSMLTPQGADELGALMRRLAASGLAIIFISHKLDEAIRFGDRVSVLRGGRHVGGIAPDRLAGLERAAAEAEIIALMFGGTAAAGTDEPRDAARAVGSGRRPVLELRNVSVPAEASGVALDHISLAVAAGEVVGVAGIDGAGQRQLAEAIAGQCALSDGSILLFGRPIDGLDVGQRRRAGVRYLTDDRLAEGSIGTLPVSTNLVAKDVGTNPFWVRGFERSSAIAEHAGALVKRFDVRTPTVTTPIGKLSGGNIQKALLARELFGEAHVVVFSKPTYGLDHNNIAATRRRIRDIAGQGVAVLLLSTDLDELIALSDRIAVMAAGRIVGEVDATGADKGALRLTIGRLMVGARAAA